MTIFTIYLILGLALAIGVSFDPVLQEIFNEEPKPVILIAMFFFVFLWPVHFYFVYFAGKGE